ncbi:hypothetical protein BT96DRAFT_1005314 [Gymnopus androsaceus JB14]|uniref:Uncharacterized protein n=1 Tax=Gymnopus androsaceus JB14 TaxID=1447944 RepID=A0A6A4GPH1_9AGAR|nr:hypothetical protein BT96DRAFT_1005314 [Gymnopus androsaceus JB14]
MSTEAAQSQPLSGELALLSRSTKCAANNGWIPDKTRAVAGATRKCLMQYERNARKSLEQQVQMLTDRNQYLVSLIDKNNADIHCFKNEKASLEDQLTKLCDEMDCADVNQGLREVAQEKVLEEMHEQTKVEIERITSEVQVQLNASRQEKEAAIQEKEAAILEKNQAFNEKAAAIQENEKTIQDLAADHMKQIKELNRAKEAADMELRTQESAQSPHNKTELEKRLQEKEAALQAKQAALREMTEARLHAEREKADFKPRWPVYGIVDEDVDMDVDDESSGSSPSSKANIGDIPALVKQVVTEVLAEQAKGNHPDNPSQNHKVKNRHSLKPGSTAYNRKVKRNALALLSREQEQKWRSLICNCFCSVTGTQQVNAFQQYHPADATIVSDYQNTDGPGPNVGEGTGYLFYFGDGCCQTRWNQTVIENLAHYITSRQIAQNVEGYFGLEAIKAYVWELFQHTRGYSAVQQARTSYRKDKPCLHEGGDRVETAGEASRRARTYTSQRQRDVHSNGQKLQKWSTWTEGVEMLLSQTLSPSDRKKWEKVGLTLRELGTQGQSSEESNAESIEHRLNITIPFFRHRILGIVFHELDEVVQALQKQEANQSGLKSEVIECGALQSLEINGSAAAESQSLDPWAQMLQTDSDTEGEQ